MLDRTMAQNQALGGRARLHHLPRGIRVLGVSGLILALPQWRLWTAKPRTLGLCAVNKRNLAGYYLSRAMHQED